MLSSLFPERAAQQVIPSMSLSCWRTSIRKPDGEPLPLWGSVIHRAEGQDFVIQFSNFSQGGARERLKALLRDAGGATAKVGDQQRDDQ